MSVLNAQNVNMYFGDKLLFRDVSFDIGEKERVALVGSNGCGKTTLFKLITGELEATGGLIVKSRDARLGYMEQYADDDPEKTIYDEILSVFSSLLKMESELEQLAQSIEAGKGNLDELIHRQSALTERFEREDGLVFRSKARAALMGLGFSEGEFVRKCSEISGGQRSKLGLCKLLLSGADLLLLDEPTNHLDISSVEWLEGFLSDYRGAAIIISHDRYFLDKVTAKTMDFSHNTLRVWLGSYSEYLKLKSQKQELEKKKYQNDMDEIRRIEAMIEQQRRFGRERNFITIASKEKMLERKREELVVPEANESQVKFEFHACAETGNEVAVLKKLSKSFENKRLFTDISMQVNRHDRMFLLGPNGCGKTTMLRIITGELKADSGYVVLGSNVKLGYFAQSLTGLNEENTVLDEVWNRYRSMSMTQVRNALASFLFRGDDVYKKVGELSGGERAKVALLKLVLSGANFLLLDEPTNHLDIASREVLEDALLSYTGTMLVVSHDRYFINKLCTRVMHLTHDSVREYLGNYDDYAAQLALPAQSAQEQAPVKVNEYKLKKERESEKRRLAGKIKRCEEQIEQNDARIAELNNALSCEEAASDYQKILDITEELRQLNDIQEELMNEWEALQEQSD